MMTSGGEKGAGGPLGRVATGIGPTRASRPIWSLITEVFLHLPYHVAVFFKGALLARASKTAYLGMVVRPAMRVVTFAAADSF